MNAEAVIHLVLSGISQNPILSGLTILVLFALLQDFFLFRKLRRLMRGSDGASLEGVIRGLQTRIEKLEANAVATNNTLRNHEGRIVRSVQGVSVKRFDPFQGAGGQQSFSTALLNEKGDGAVISGIHARDGVRVYAKQVKEFKSERELSEDEMSAIDDARKKL
jgi:hypothetical protein